MFRILILAITESACCTGSAGGLQACARAAAVRCAAHRRHGAARRPDCRDENGRGQDPRGCAASLPQCSGRQGRSGKLQHNLQASAVYEAQPFATANQRVSTDALLTPRTHSLSGPSLITEQGFHRTHCSNVLYSASMPLSLMACYRQGPAEAYTSARVAGRVDIHVTRRLPLNCDDDGMCPCHRMPIAPASTILTASWPIPVKPMPQPSKMEAPCLPPSLIPFAHAVTRVRTCTHVCVCVCACEGWRGGCNI